MSNTGRPLSPHLSIFRWPITMVLSILHRVTGVGMAVGLLVYASWLLAASGSAEYYATISGLLATVPGRILLVAWSAAFFLHLGNGIRHLVWDSGRGFERSQANASGWTVVVVTVILTLLYWWLL
jgi:succinate dehydrogenase / fumarate reductase cytochrome b subunit